MAVGIFPVAKLGVLALKQISKPIANIIKSRAKQSQFFRQYICMPPAQFYNWVDVKTKMWAMNLGKPTVVPQLNEAMAIELGANLLGEVIIFTIGAGVLIFEYIRSSNNDFKKQEAIKQERLELTLTLNDMAFRVERQDTQIREMTRIIAELESRSWLPRKPKIIADTERFLSEPSVSNLPEKRTNISNPSDLPKSQSEPTITNIGNEYRRNGLLIRALNFLDDEIFCRDNEPAVRRKGFVTEALESLKYNA